MGFKKKTIIWEDNNEPPKDYIWIKSDKKAYEYDYTDRIWKDSKIFKHIGPATNFTGKVISKENDADAYREIWNIWKKFNMYGNPCVLTCSDSYDDSEYEGTKYSYVGFVEPIGQGMLDVTLYIGEGDNLLNSRANAGTIYFSLYIETDSEFLTPRSTVEHSDIAISFNDWDVAISTQLAMAMHNFQLNFPFTLDIYYNGSWKHIIVSNNEDCEELNSAISDLLEMAEEEVNPDYVNEYEYGKN